MIRDSNFHNAATLAPRTIRSDKAFIWKRLSLGRSSAERPRDALPLVSIGHVLGQMQYQSAHRRMNPCAEFDQFVTQGTHLRTLKWGAFGRQPHFLHQHVSRCGNQRAGLVRPEARAAGAVDLHSMVKLLDPIFDLTAPAVNPSVQISRRACQIGHDKARIVFWRFAFGANHLHFVDHATLVLLPTFGSVASLSKKIRMPISFGLKWALHLFRRVGRRAGICSSISRSLE